MEKSSIKIISNIVLKSSYEKNPNAFLPYDLLPRVYRDVRSSDDLTAYQRKRQIKQLYWTEKIIEED